MSWPAELTVRPLTELDAGVVATWRYDGPWRVYDPAELVGFCCSGPEARVPGLEGEPGVLDVGLGMDPSRVGHGHGVAFGRTVLDHYRQRGARNLRAVVQSWNERSLRVVRALGFVETDRHTCVQNGRPVEYVVLQVDLSAAGAGW